MSHSEARGSGHGLAERACLQQVLRAAAVCVLLLGPSAASASPSTRAAAELIPEGSRFFLEVDLGALREKGPTDAVRHVISTLAPIASESGLSAERLRSIIMASAEEPINGDKLPSWLLFAQDGAAPSMSKLEAAFQRYTRAALKPATVHGIAYRGNHDLSLVQLPGGPALIAGASGPAEVVEAWRGGSGKAAAPLIHSSRGELLQRAAGEGPTAFRVWLLLSSAMQRSLVDDAHVPAVPLEVASALRLLADRGAELGILARCSDEETAKKLATWLGTRLAVLASSGEVQLLGLSSYIQASKVVSDGPVARLQLSLSAGDLAALLERAVGMMASLAPRASAVRPEEKTGERTGEKTGEKTGAKTAAKPGEKTAAKPAGKAAAKPPSPK